MLRQTTTVLMIVSVDVLSALGEFRRIRIQQSVAEKDILSVEKTSVTGCHLKCHAMSACVGYGIQNMGVDEPFVDCHLLKKTSVHNPETEGKHIRLDVIEMVCSKFCSELSVLGVNTFFLAFFIINQNRGWPFECFLKYKSGGLKKLGWVEKFGQKMHHEMKRNCPLYYYSRDDFGCPNFLNFPKIISRKFSGKKLPPRRRDLTRGRRFEN